MRKTSEAELAAAAILAAQPIPSIPCQSFADADLATTYTDAAGEVLTGKPDFLCRQSRSFTLLEFKAGKLNHHITHESSRAALQCEYESLTRRIYFESLPHTVTSGYLWNYRPRACLDHGFNHSVWKLLALQAEHSWQRYIVCFEKTPSKRDAMRYLELGLVFCTVDTAPDLLRTIELAQHGIYLPFVFSPKRAKYSFTVTPDHTDKGRPAEEVAQSDRAKFLATVAAYEAAQAAQSAADVADLAPSILPF